MHKSKYSAWNGRSPSLQMRLISYSGDQKLLQIRLFIGYKNVFGPIAVLATNRFRLEQKSYLPLKLQFKSGFGKTTI
jgi:hypothetical protein